MACTLLLWIWPNSAFGQQSKSPPAQNDDAQVTLDFPESVEVQALIDYVSQTLGLNIVYDESIRGRKVVLRSPESIPKKSLLGLRRSVLRTAGLALIEDDHPGWLQVVQVKALQSHVREIRRDVATRPATTTRVVTQILHVRHADAAKVATTIKPFLSTPGGAALAVEGTGLLIVTDYEATVVRVMELIDLMDVAVPEAEVAIVPVRHQDAAAVTARVTQILTDKAKFAADAKGPAEATLTVSPDAASQTITLIGLPDQIAEAREFIEQFDVSTPQATVTRRQYTPRFVSAARVKGLIDGVIAAPAGEKESTITVFIDTESNALYATATQAQHEEIDRLIKELDASPPESARPMRFYKLMNRKASEVFATLSSLLADDRSGFVEKTATPERPRVNPGGPTVSGPNRPGAEPSVVRVPSSPPAYTPSGAGQESASRQRGPISAQGEDFKLTVDEATNTLIVVATVELHTEIEKLVRELDKRRPQVLIELTMVSITASDSLALGIELEALDLGDPWDYILFSTFGLSSIDTATGARTLNPGVGFNGALLGPDEVPILMQALATRAEARTLAAPRILVGDNGTATIASVDQAPFTSLNASDTVATTSFAGFADAGTTVSVTPHIAEGDHLAVDYQLTFSSFTGAASGTAAPPPRSSNTISSTVEVPDGYTVVVGGLLVDNSSESISEVPFVGRIPGLGLLFQNNSRSGSKSRIYAFIRPTILRDDAFEDLKFISAEQVKAAGLENDNFPRVEPMWMTNGSAELEVRSEK